MDFHHVTEAAGIVVIGLVLYSYMCRWVSPAGMISRQWRTIAMGTVFGVLSVSLLISRIQVGDGLYLDARAVPLALVGLLEGGPAVALAAAIVAAYRISRGGSGVIGGIVGIAGTAIAAWLIHRWAQRTGRVTTGHALILSVIVYAVNFTSFVVLGQRGWALFAPMWFPFLVLFLVGIGLMARLFAEVASAAAAEASRREAAALRATALLARAAAHEINNPLNIVIGGLSIVSRRQPPGSEDAEWLARASAGAHQIKDIVVRMNRITEIKTTEGAGTAPPMLDVRKSSADEPNSGASG